MMFFVRARLLLAVALLGLAWSNDVVAQKKPVVPPTLEIELLDPNADPLGNPAVTTTQVGDRDVVEIPPVVLVHRYYYSGDREFQGPLIPGGPTILVVNHPKTNECLYIPLQMLPGAPTVIYRKKSIEYDYGRHAITLSFGLCGKPKITYRTGKPLTAKAKDVVSATVDHTGELATRMNIPVYASNLAAGAKNVTVTTADRIGDVSKMVILPVVNVAQLIPFAKMLTSTPEQQAQSLRDSKLEFAAQQQQRQPEFIPSNR